MINQLSKSAPAKFSPLLKVAYYAHITVSFLTFDFLEAEFQRLKPDFKLNDYIDSRLDTLILAKAFRTGKNQKK